MSHHGFKLSLATTASWGKWLRRAEAARDLGYEGVCAVAGDLADDAPTTAEPGFIDWLPISLLQTDDDAAPALRELLSDELVGDILRAVRSHQAKGVVLAGLELSQSGAAERGRRLLAHLRESGKPPAQEGAEVLISELAQHAERDLELLARFIHALRLRAPGIPIAFVAEASPAGVISPARLKLLVEEGGFQRLHYWHDTGRCESRAQLGVDHPGDWLDSFAAMTVGATLHDWQAGSDLRLPGDGRVDFRLVAEYLPRSAQRVVNAAPFYPSGLLPAAADALEAAGL